MSDEAPGRAGRPGHKGRAGQGDGEVRAAGRQQPYDRRGREKLRGPLLRECETPYKRTSGQVIAVLRYPNGGHTVWWPDRREDHNKPLFRGPFTAFEVALGRHVTEFEIDLPAAGDSESFKARARVHWEVADPFLVVDRLVWDAAEMLHDDLLERLRDVSRRFALTQAERVDRAVRAELASDRFALGDDLGLRTKVHVFIDLSERVMNHEREHTDLKHEFGVTTSRDRWESQRIAARAQEFEQMLRRGNIAQIAGFMAREPGRELEIRNLIRQEWREEQQVSIELFSRMLDSGHLERHDIGEHMYEVIQYLRARSDGVVGNTMDQVLLDGRGPRGELAPGGDRGFRRQRFWEEDEDSAVARAPGGDAGNADTVEDGGGDVADPGDDDRDPKDDWDPWDGQPAPDRTAPRRGGRASDTFSDWDAP